MPFLYQLIVINTAARQTDSPTTQAPVLPLGLVALVDVSNLQVKNALTPCVTSYEGQTLTGLKATPIEKVTKKQRSSDAVVSKCSVAIHSANLNKPCPCVLEMAC